MIKHPHIQATLLARVFRNELDEYPPFHWRSYPRDDCSFL